jgi:tripartite ATP-independent transporter DctP family solute receptor
MRLFHSITHRSASAAVLLLACLALGLASPATAQTTIRLAHVNPALPFENPNQAMAVVFGSVLETESQGQIKTQLFPSGQLGKERELLESVKIGTIQAVILADGSTVNFFQPLEVLGIPYVFPDLQTAWKVFDGPFGQELKEAFRQQTGIRILGSTAPGGFRHFAASNPLNSIGDLKGKRIRTMDHPLHQAAVSALGASPTPIPFAELYTAIKSGVADGLELPFGAILNSKLDEVVKFIIADGHVLNQELLMVNDSWYSALSSENKLAVNKAAADAQAASRGVTLITEAVGPDQLRAKGVQIYFPTAAERAEFRKIAQPPTLEILRKRIDPKWVDGILKAVAEANAEK